MRACRFHNPVHSLHRQQGRRGRMQAGRACDRHVDAERGVCSPPAGSDGHLRQDEACRSGLTDRAPVPQRPAQRVVVHGSPPQAVEAARQLQQVALRRRCLIRPPLLRALRRLLRDLYATACQMMLCALRGAHARCRCAPHRLCRVPQQAQHTRSQPGSTAEAAPLQVQVYAVCAMRQQGKTCMRCSATCNMASCRLVNGDATAWPRAVAPQHATA